MKRIPFATIYQELLRVLVKTGFAEEPAQLCARLFAETSLDGVYSHGLNRFPRFMEFIAKGYINIQARPERVQSFGMWEQWDGNRGPGNLNAYYSMNQALALARTHGLGCVALKNTNHWMRGGSYGWQAVEAGCVGICWTNTAANLPAWGAQDCRLGNNPLVLAVPRPQAHVVLDMSMSQFSYGKMQSARSRGELLPFEGGYDREGNLTRDPGAILEARRPLPIGYWKGSGLSLLLELIAVLLSGGESRTQAGNFEDERGISQVFIAFDLTKLPDQHLVGRAVAETIANLHQSVPSDSKGKVYYPGERTLQTRLENLESGIPVDDKVWEAVQSF
jgi:3-dehydro-L-gulonate 2-dehydrogenase